MKRDNSDPEVGPGGVIITLGVAIQGVEPPENWNIGGITPKQKLAMGIPVAA